MVYGMSVPFLNVASQGHNLSSGTLTGYAASYNFSDAYNTLYNCKAIGFNAVNIWLFTTFEGIEFDENLKPVGLKKDFVNNLTSLLQIAEKLDVGLTFTIQPHIDVLTSSGFGGSKDVYAEYFAVFSDSEKRSAYISNVVEPVLELIAEYESNIVSIISYCEPELEYIGEITKTVNTDLSATKAIMYSVITEISNASKAIMPKVPVGIALCDYNNYNDYKALETNGTLDFIGYDTYNASGYLPSTDMKVITECGITSDSTDYVTNITNFFTNAKNAGYKAVYYWSYTADNITGIVNFADAKRYSAIEAIYKIIRDIRAEKGMISDYNTPVVLCDKNYVVFLAPKNASYYQIHRYDGLDENGNQIWNMVKDYGANVGIGVYAATEGGYYKVTNFIDGVGYSSVIPVQYVK